MLIDSHCHLNFPDFKEDLDHVFQNAWNCGVQGFLTVNTRLDEAKELQSIAETQKNVACTVGLHPHETKDCEDTPLKEQLQELANHPRVVGIGETGLDYYYNHSPRESQIWSFIQHIDVARTLDLPLIIHTRDADDDTIAVLRECEGQSKGVFHCFSGTLDLCRHALDLGFYISISGIVTFKKALNVHTVAKFVPLDRLLLETDAPYLAPVPHRGKPRNEPAFIIHTAECVAELRGIPLSKLSQGTTENFFNLFSRARGFFHYP